MRLAQWVRPKRISMMGSIVGLAVVLYLRVGGDGARDPGTWDILGQGGARHHSVQEQITNCRFLASSHWFPVELPRLLLSVPKQGLEDFSRTHLTRLGQLRVSRKLRPSIFASSHGF